MDEILQRLLRGELRAVEMPARLNLAPLWDDLAELCYRSLGVRPKDGGLLRVPGDVQVEWGACLLMNGVGLVLFHQVMGWAEGVNPHADCFPVTHAPPVYGGFAHTHVPDQYGKPLPGFSSLDYRATLADGDNLALVCNGPHVFALARTIDCTAPPHAARNADFRRWQRLYDESIQQALAGMEASRAVQAGGSDALSRALVQANRAMCLELGFAFYGGDWGRPLSLLFRPRRRMTP